MNLASLCKHDFDSTTRTRGQTYHRQRRVRIGPHEEFGVNAEVDGSSSFPYAVVINWSVAHEGTLIASCSCPRWEDGFLCKHVWATVLEIDARGLLPDHTLARFPRQLDIVDTEEMYGEDDELVYGDLEHDDLEDAGQLIQRGQLAAGGQRAATSSKQTAKAKQPRPAAWQQRLHPLSVRQSTSRAERLLPAKTREFWITLDVDRSVEANAMVLTLFQRERKLDGEFGKKKPIALDRDTVIEAIGDPDERDLFMLLLSSDSSLRSRYFSPYSMRLSQIELDHAAFAYVLPRLCAHERFIWSLSGDLPIEDGRRVAWDAGEPWRFRLHVDADDDRKQWTLIGRLARPGEEPVALDKTVLVLNAGVVLFEDRMARFDGAEQFDWIPLLNQGGPVTVPYKDKAAFLDFLWKFPHPPETDLPGNLRCDEIRVSPRGCLKIHPPGKTKRRDLPADVFFDYEGQSIPVRNSQAGLFDRDGQRVLIRDRDAETRLLSELADLGVEEKRNGYDYGYGYGHRQQGDFVIMPRHLSRIVERLVSSGWLVEAEGQLIRRPGTVQISVSSSVDWFDLSGEVDFEGVSARLPDLLAALRKGEKTVKLSDGTQGMLPDDWLAQYGGLAEFGQSNGEAVRFRPSQTLLLDALLAATPQVSVDRTFDRFRKKLKSLSGVKPKNEPRGFVGRLRDYQRTGLGWLQFLQAAGFGGCLADDMGLGKTVQVLAHLESRRTRKDRPGPSLAVVPKSLVFNWIEEAARFTPKLRVLDYTGIDRAAHRDRFDEFDLVVTTYGTLRREIAELKDRTFDYAILDESQAIKNANSQNAKACRLIQARHRLAMTGTPIENHLGELWSLFEFLNPGLLGRSTAFQALTKRGSDNGDAAVMLSRALAPFLLRRTKEQVLTELPDKTEQTLHCELSKRERKQYDEIRNFYRASLQKQIDDNGLERSKIHVLEALLRLRQAACHQGLIDKDKADEPSAKLDALLEQLAEVVAEGHKAIVFSQFTSLLGILRTRLDRQQTVYEYLDGRTRNRAARVRRFQEDADCRIFLVSLKAGGHGLNLTAADYVFLLDPWWNPAVESQAIDRAHRLGQTRPVFAYRLIARDTVEEKILELQRTKRDLADAVITANDSLIRKLTAEDLTLLLS